MHSLRSSITYKTNALPLSYSGEMGFDPATCTFTRAHIAKSAAQLDILVAHRNRITFVFRGFRPRAPRPSRLAVAPGAQAHGSVRPQSGLPCRGPGTAHPVAMLLLLWRLRSGVPSCLHALALLLCTCSGVALSHVLPC